MSSEKLTSAIAAIKTGDKSTGSRLLNELLLDNPKNESAWIWLATCVDDVNMKLDCLKKAHAINPDNQLVTKAINKLEQPAQPNLEEILPNRDSQNPPISTVPLIEIDNPKKTSKPSFTRTCTFVIIAIIGILIVGYLISTLSGSSSSNTASTYLHIGEQGVLYNGSSQIPVAATRDVLDQVIHMSTANDTLGYAELVGAGLVIRVDSETDVLILDSTSLYKQVRILEGEYVGESGWIPSEWVRKK
jgi:hypothetical protein